MNKRYFFVSYFWRFPHLSGHGSCTLENDGFLNMKKVKDAIRIGVERGGYKDSIIVITNFIEMSEQEYHAFNEGSELSGYEVG